MQSLTRRLGSASSGSGFDARVVGETAEAIEKVSRALMKVKELQWSEREASWA